jgi:hypothetical protein
MKKIDTDVAAWYNSLFPTGSETYTLAQLRTSLLTYIGLTEDASTLPLPNDSMVVSKTLETNSLSGRTVIEAIEEINGVFGHISPDGLFEHIILSPAYGDYPQEDYPQNDYPISADDKTFVDPDFIKETITSDMRENVRFEEYTVKEIDKLIIRTDADDIGAIVGTGSNAYIIQGNFLVYGKSAAELSLIAHRAYGYMAKRPYRPFESTGIGLPYLKVGDVIMHDQDDPVVSYVLKRTLSGIQALTDALGATGAEQLPQNTTVNEEIKILKAKTTRITKTVDGVKVVVEDLEANVSSEISALAGQIVLKAKADGSIAMVSLGADPSTGSTIQIKADNVELEGLITANGYFKILDDGSMEAVNGKFSGSLTSSGSNGTVYIADGLILGGVANVDGVYTPIVTITDNLTAGQISLTASSGIVSCTQLNTQNINGYTPVTLGNIAQQSVNYATSAGSASSAGYATSANSADSASLAMRSEQLYNIGNGAYVYVSASRNFRPDYDAMGSCGSSEAKWTAVYAQSGTIQTSDRRKKDRISPLSDKYLMFARKLLSLPRTYIMVDGQSGRIHAGFVAQDVENAMSECDITDMEFAGLIKSPVYSKKLIDRNGVEIDEYDTSSEIIDYSYGLRYEEFIPLLFGFLNQVL